LPAEVRWQSLELQSTMAASELKTFLQGISLTKLLSTFTDEELTLPMLEYMAETGDLQESLGELGVTAADAARIAVALGKPGAPQEPDDELSSFLRPLELEGLAAMFREEAVTLPLLKDMAQAGELAEALDELGVAAADAARISEALGAGPQKAAPQAPAPPAEPPAPQATPMSSLLASALSLIESAEAPPSTALAVVPTAVVPTAATKRNNALTAYRRRTGTGLSADPEHDDDIYAIRTTQCPGDRGTMVGIGDGDDPPKKAPRFVPTYEWQELPPHISLREVPPGLDEDVEYTGGPWRVRIPPTWDLSVWVKFGAHLAHPTYFRFKVGRRMPMSEVREAAAEFVKLPYDAVRLNFDGKSVSDYITVEKLGLWGNMDQLKLYHSSLGSNWRKDLKPRD